MKAADIIAQAVKSALRGRRKTLLSALSISIGVASVILISSLGESGKAEVERQVEKLGISGITIYRNTISGSEPLSAEDARYIEARVQNVRSAVPVMVEYGSYRLKNTAGSTVIWGVGEQMERAVDVTLKYGRLPSATDIKYSNPVAVVDDALAKKAYKRDNIVGKTITLLVKGVSMEFEVIGVIETQKSAVNMLVGDVVPEFVYIPFGALSAMAKRENADQIVVRCLSDEEMRETELSVLNTLNRKKGVNDGYLSENISGYKDQLGGVLAIVSLIVSAVAAISLCVAGLGVMNSMFSAASERRREIGISMAIGVRRCDIALCFLTESAAICLTGGAVGTAAGISGSLAVMAIMNLPIRMSLSAIAAALFASFACGIVFGMIPAIRASGLDPITALRD